MRRYYTRKEIAYANEVTERTVSRRERQLGLHELRDPACTKPVRYNANATSERLRRHGWNCPED